MSVRNVTTYALAVLAVLAVVFALDLMLMLFAAIIIGVLLSALANGLSRLTGLARHWALATVILAIISSVTLLIWTAAPAIRDELVQFQLMLPQALNRLQEMMKDFVWLETLFNALPTGEAMERRGVGGRLFVGALSTTVNVFVVLVLAIYLAATPTVYVDGAVRLFPLRHRSRAREVLEQMYQTLKGWLLGLLISMTLVGMLMFVGLKVIGIPLAGALGVIAGLFEFIPYIGPWLGGIFAVVMSLGVSPDRVLYVIPLVLAIQISEAYVITPLVMKRVIHLPPALTLTALVVGSLVGGWMGLLLATPALAMIMVLVKMVYIEDILGDAPAPADRTPAVGAARRKE